MIYIDPPYNTGNDFIYDDNFSMSREEYEAISGGRDEEGQAMFDEEKWKQNSSSSGRFHSEWLSMMYPRLKLARNLLREDGVIFVSIDDGEVANLREVCDEVFGSDNFLGNLVWKRSYGGGAKSKHTVCLHDHILGFARSKSFLDPIELPPNNDVLKYYKYRDSKLDQRGPYRKQPLATNSMDLRPNLRFPISHSGEDIWPEKQWQWSRERVTSAQAADELVFTEKDTGWTVDYKQYLRDEEGKIRGAKLYSVIEGPFTQAGTSEIFELFGDGKVFTFPKPTGIVKHLLGVVGRDSIILDFFSGSATTAHAVMQLNAEDGGSRRDIMVQLPEPCDETSEAFKAGYATIAEIGKERIRRAGTKIRADLAAKLAATKEGAIDHQTLSDRLASLDTGFRVLKIDSSNLAEVHHAPDQVDQADLLLQVDNIKADRSAEDLLFQVLLDWGVDLALPVTEETIAGRRVFFVDGNALAACFDADLDEPFIKALAKRAAESSVVRAVFRDAGYANDAVKINIEQIFKALSPHTELKTI